MLSPSRVALYSQAQAQVSCLVGVLWTLNEEGCFFSKKTRVFKNEKPSSVFKNPLLNCNSLFSLHPPGPLVERLGFWSGF